MIDQLASALGAAFLPFVIAALSILVLVVLIRFANKNYIKVPPNMVAVISGRKRTITSDTGEKVKVGYRLVRGGATLIIPFLERRDDIDLRVITIPDLKVVNAITKEGVPLTVQAVANIKIGSEEALLMNAVERLLGKHQDEVKRIAYETLEGHLRSMLGTLTIEQVNADRAAFSGKMVSESQTDLAKLGLKIDVLTVKELADPSGYLEALGKQRTSEVKMAATIGSAQADKTAMIESTGAKREGEVARQGNLAKEAEADKDRAVKVATYVALTTAEQARAAQAGPLATAEARCAVVEAEQQVILTQTEKATAVALAEANRKQQELLATVVRPAEAQKAAAIAVAEGEASAIRIRALAEQDRLIAVGQGEAQATRLTLVAEADGIKAKLLAEAEGTLKKAEAYKALNEAGRLLQILEAAQHLVPNAIREFAAVVGAAAKPFGDADKIVVVDSGGPGNGGGGGALERLSNAAPNLVFTLVTKAKEMGLDLTELLQKAGVGLDKDARP